MFSSEILAEWRIRKIKPPLSDLKEDKERWILASLGLDDREQGIYFYLASRRSTTVEDLVEEFGFSEDEARDVLDKLYTLGIVEKLGREYFVKYSLGEAVLRRTLPRLVEVLKSIARVESSFRAYSFGRIVGGRSFNSVRNAIPYIRYLSERGAVKVKVTGVHVYSGRTIEVEGLVQRVDSDNCSLRILVDGGEMEVGDYKSEGVDVKASSIIVYEVKGDE